jgi:hypothetical protein
MEIKQGAEGITLTIKPRVGGQVVDMSTWAALYGESSPGLGTYTLISETADKTSSIEIVASSVSAAGMIFTLPNSMFETAQRVWTNSLKFLLNSITDFSLYNFEIKVTKGSSVNSR